MCPDVEAVNSSETSVNIYRTTLSEDSTIHWSVLKPTCGAWYIKTHEDKHRIFSNTPRTLFFEEVKKLKKLLKQ
jgi:hypothetical protein